MAPLIESAPNETQQTSPPHPTSDPLVAFAALGLVLVSIIVVVGVLAYPLPPLVRYCVIVLAVLGAALVALAIYLKQTRKPTK